MLAAQAGPNMLLPCAAVYEWKQECGYLYAAGDELPVPLVHVWDAGREQCVGEISTQSSAAVTCLSCAPGETGTLVGGTANGGVFTFDVRTPTGLLSSSQCHSQGVVNAFSSEHNPHTIISGSGGGELKWWDIRGGISTPYRTVRTAKAGISAIAPHPHLPLLACGSTDQAVEIFNTKEGEQLNILKHQNSFLGHRIPPVHCLDFHPFAVRWCSCCFSASFVIFVAESLVHWRSERAACGFRRCPRFNLRWAQRTDRWPNTRRRRRRSVRHVRAPAEIEHGHPPRAAHPPSSDVWDSMGMSGDESPAPKCESVAWVQPASFKMFTLKLLLCYATRSPGTTCGRSGTIASTVLHLWSRCLTQPAHTALANRETRALGEASAPGDGRWPSSGQQFPQASRLDSRGRPW